MISMRAMQKLMQSSSLRGVTNLCRRCPLSTRAPLSVVTTPSVITVPGTSLEAASTLRKMQYHFSSQFMSSSATSQEPVGVDLSLDKLRMSIAGGDYIRLLKEDNEYVDVVQYTHKNVVYNVSHIDYHSEALAIGLTENGLIPGDVVLTFLPPHLCETMMIQFACSKSGLVLYNIDPDLAIDDPFKAKEVVKEALTLTKANVFISFEAANDVNYIRLVESVVPELRFFDFSTGMPFISPRFPHLRFCVHTGMDQHQKWGWLPLHHMVVPSHNLDTHIDLKLVHNKTPLAGQIEYDATGIPIGLGHTLTNAEVFEKKHWPTYCKVLERQFHVVEGVGVTF